MSDSSTQWVGLVGWPVEHSVSPAMHNAAFAGLGLNWRYKLLPTEAGRLPEVMGLLREGQLQGVNVTVPHKQAVLPLLDTVSRDARAIGAVNTIVVRDGRLHGHNTDGAGFLAALRGAGVDVAGRRALVLGAGGAARAVCYGLLQAGIDALVVFNRTLARAELLASAAREWQPAPVEMHTTPLGVQTQSLTAGALVASAGEADLLVNTTSVGMWPQVQDSPWPAGERLPARLAVLDLVYNPLETALLRQARASGARAVDGLGMLVHQGALAFELWTGQAPPLDGMRAAAERALG